MDNVNNTRSLSLRLDVTGSVALPGPLSIAATVFLPDAALLPERPVAVFAFPGGGYARGYYDMHFPGHTGYSEAEYHTARGFIFVALDHLGVGESSVTGLATMQIEDIARANDVAVRQIRARIEAGTLAEGFPAVANLFAVGSGQSMGGGVTIIMQGRHRTYDAIAPMGYSAIHTVLPQRSEADRLRGIAGHGRSAGRSTDPAELDLAESSRSTADYVYPFHWEDVPADILNADMAGGYPIRKTAPAWGSVTIPNCVIAMMSPGFVKEEAAVIDVPVLMAMGERDTIPNPMAEPSAFAHARDASVFVVPQMAHMHNFASTRALLWRRFHAWARMVSGN
jgi:pimeloyl-ACP methyl ester carboxylesterase